MQDCEALLGRGAKRDPLAAPAVRLPEKHCCRCRADKPAELFFRSKTSLDGLCTYCKVRTLEQHPSPRLVSAEMPESGGA